MNKIFKVIWSKIKNCWVVVSEIAKRHSKTTVQQGGSVALSAVVALILLAGTSVCRPVWSTSLIGGEVNVSSDPDWSFQAGYGGNINGLVSATLGTHTTVGRYLYNGTQVYVRYSNDESKINNANYNSMKDGIYHIVNLSTGQEIATFDAAKTFQAAGLTRVNESNFSMIDRKGNSALAFGFGSTAVDRQSVAFGAENVALGPDSLAYGYLTRATGNQSVSFGFKTTASGDISVAFGNENVASGRQSVAFGAGNTASGADAVAFGYLSKATGSQSVAFGRSSTASGTNSLAALGATAMAEGSFAVGSGAYVSQNGTVALGSGSRATRGTSGDGGWDPRTKTYSTSTSTAYKANAAAIAVGNDTTITRQITGLAAGSYSTDAVNVQQLRDLQSDLESDIAVSNTLNTKGTDGTGSVKLASQALSVTGGNTNINTKAENQGITVNLSNTLDLGANGSVTTGAAKMQNSGFTVGSSNLESTGLSIINGPSVTTNGINAGNRKITNVAKGTADTDAVNYSQIKSLMGSDNTALNSLTFKGETGQTTKQLGQTLEIVGDGENVTTKVENDKLIVGMDLDLDLDKLVIHGKNGKDGISVQGADGKDGVTIWAEDGKDGSEGHIGLTGPKGSDGKNAYADIYVKEGSPGVDGKDGITRIMYTDEDGTDHQVATLDDGMVFMGDSGTKVAKKLNEQLNITGGATGTLTDNNIGVVADGSALSVKLAKDIDLGTTGSVKFGTTGPSLSKDGLDMKGTKISGVADGTLANDAVNYSQLQALANQIGGQVSNLGELKTAGNQGTGSVNLASQTLGVKGSDSNITVTAGGSDLTVQLAKNIDLGSNGSLTAGPVSIGKDGIDAGGKKITNVGDGEISSTSTDAITGKQVAPLFGSDGTMKGLTFRGNDGANTAEKKLGETIGILGGATGDDGSFSTANIRTKVADGNIQISLAKDLKDINSLTTNGGVKIDGNGIDAGNKTVTNVADGSDRKDAVNYGQLQDAVSGLTGSVDSVMLNAAGDTGRGASVNLKTGTLNVVGNPQSALTEGNIGVAAAGDTLTVKLAKDINLGSNGSLTAGPVSIGKDGIDAGGKKITNVGDGEISPTSTDAITGKQVAPLFGSDGTMKGLTFRGNDGANTAEKKLGETIGILGGATGDDGSFSTANIRTKVTDGNIQISLAKELKDINSLTTNGGVKIDGNGIDAGNKTVTNVADGSDRKDAVNYGQLQDAVSGLTGAVGDVTLKAYGDTGRGASVNLQNGELNVVGGATGTLTDNNIGVVAAGDTLTVKLAQDIDLGKNGSLSIGDTGPSISKDGIDGGGQQITNVDAGTKAAT